MIGLVVGLISGGFQYWLLSRFTSRISTGTVNFGVVVFGLLQFFIPMGVLLAMAFIKRSDLLWTAVGIIGCLLICAVTKFVIHMRKTRGREDNNV